MKQTPEIIFDIIRAERRLTRYQAAEQMGLSRDHLRAVLRGTSPAGDKAVNALYKWSSGRIDLRRLGDEQEAA